MTEKQTGMYACMYMHIPEPFSLLLILAAVLQGVALFRLLFCWAPAQCCRVPRDSTVFCIDHRHRWRYQEEHTPSHWVPLLKKNKKTCKREQNNMFKMPGRITDRSWRRASRWAESSLCSWQPSPKPCRSCQAPDPPECSNSPSPSRGTPPTQLWTTSTPASALHLMWLKVWQVRLWKNLFWSTNEKVYIFFSTQSN